MRTVGMLRTGSILVFFIVSQASSLPLQWLPAIPGYVPVYIRHGDEPLEDINLALAEAFAEDKSFPKNVRNTHEAPAIGEPAKNEEIDEQVAEIDTKDEVNVPKTDDIPLEKEELVKEPSDRETNRPNVPKKSETVSLEVNRSKIPQLLTIEEHKSEETKNKEPVPEKSTPQDDSENSDFQPNEVIDPNPNYPELPVAIIQDHDREEIGSHSMTNSDDSLPIPGVRRKIPSIIKETAETIEEQSSNVIRDVISVIKSIG